MAVPICGALVAPLMGALVGLTLLGGLVAVSLPKPMRSQSTSLLVGAGVGVGVTLGVGVTTVSKVCPPSPTVSPVVAVHYAVGFHIAGAQNHTGGKQQRRNSRPLQPRMAAPVRGRGCFTSTLRFLKEVEKEMLQTSYTCTKGGRPLHQAYCTGKIRENQPRIFHAA